MPFQKGKSGNPNGRPKRNHAMTDTLRALLEKKNRLSGRRNRELVVEALIEAAQAGNVAAMNLIYERLDGKLITQAQISAPDGGPLVFTLKLGKEEDE